MEMGMDTGRYFVASEYDLTLRLQALFHETVALQARADNAELKDERIELELKLEAVHGEISRLVKEMKYLLSDAEVVSSPISLTLGASRRGR
jgi:hypothetical protein